MGNSIGGDVSQAGTGGGGGITPPAGDIGGTTSAPTVVNTHLTSPLPTAQGGTGDTSGVPAAATTVTGPDAYGASAVVGVGTEYARDDHDHGLPAAPSASLATESGQLSSVVPMSANVATAIFVTPSLAIGTWLISGGICIAQSVVPTANVIIRAGIVSNVAGATTGLSNSQDTVTVADGTSPRTVYFNCIVTITTAGTVNIDAVSAAAASADATYTGYTAVKIA